MFPPDFYYWDTYSNRRTVNLPHSSVHVDSLIGQVVLIMSLKQCIYYLGLSQVVPKMEGHRNFSTMLV